MSEGLTTLKANTRTMREYVIDCITAGNGKNSVVPFVQGSPGIGKSAIIRSIADEYGLELIDHRLSTSVPEDLSGLPEFYTDEKGNRRARFSPFNIFPIENQDIPTGKEGWLLFLDEFNSASKSVQAASYKLILDKAVGQNRLHERVVIVTAGNLATDRAITNSLSTAMQSRVVHIEMELVFEHWLKDVGLKFGWDDRILAYLQYDNSKLYDFRPDHNEKTFCCPRTWEFMNHLIIGKTFKEVDINNSTSKMYDMELKAPLYAGTITSGVATEFIQFTKVFLSLPKVEDILANPQSVPVPDDRALRFAVATHLVSKITPETFDTIAAYINRFSAEFRIIFFRSLMIRRTDLRTHPAFRAAMGELAKYLYD